MRAILTLPLVSLLAKSDEDFGTLNPAEMTVARNPENVAQNETRMKA